MSGWKMSSSSPRTKEEPQLHNSKGWNNFKFSKTHIAYSVQKRVVEYLQNYKLITQPAGKAALKETQARKVRNGDTGNFSHSSFVSLPPVFPKTVRHAFSSIFLASQRNSSYRCSFQSTYSVFNIISYIRQVFNILSFIRQVLIYFLISGRFSMSFLISGKFLISFFISGRFQLTQVVLHPFQGQTHIRTRGALGKNYGIIWESFPNDRSTSPFWEPLVQSNFVLVKQGNFGTIPI